MKSKSKNKKSKKGIMSNVNLSKQARDILMQDLESKEVEKCLKSLSNKKTNEAMWEATQEFIKAAHDPNFKPLFS